MSRSSEYECFYNFAYEDSNSNFIKQTQTSSKKAHRSNSTHKSTPRLKKLQQVSAMESDSLNLGDALRIIATGLGVGIGYGLANVILGYKSIGAITDDTKTAKAKEMKAKHLFEQ